MLITEDYLGFILEESLSFNKPYPAIPTKRTLVFGREDLLADAYYDDNEALGIMFKEGCSPIVKPEKSFMT